MSFDIIQVLLLDGKVLCVKSKALKTKVLIKHLCIYLHMDQSGTLGLMYKDTRGLDQWLDDSKMISDHDIAPYDRILYLLFNIRFIPHHVCDQEINIHQLFLLAGRLLRQDWFISQIEIHSQLVALFILSRYGGDLSDSNVFSAINTCGCSMLDPISKDNCFDYILDAYKIYREKFVSVVDFQLKFLQLMMGFPIFTSRLFVISNSKGEKYLLGINSIEMTIFYLDRYHEIINKVMFKNVENIMRRDIKIIISLLNKQKNNRSMSDNEMMVTIYALSTHQSDCIYLEIETCWNEYKRSATTPCSVNQLMKNTIFKKKFAQWLRENESGQSYGDYHTTSIDMHLIPTDVKDQVNIEQQFGEVKMYDSDIYLKLSQVTPSSLEHVSKPMQDIEQLVSEKERLKTILNEKLSQLLDNCNTEKELTNSMPVEYGIYFSSGNLKFIRNVNPLASGRKNHKGCAAEIKNKMINGGKTKATESMSRENANYHSSHSSHHVRGSMSPLVTVHRMKTSQSVTDLRLMNSSPMFYDESNQTTAMGSSKPSMSPSSTDDSHCSTSTRQVILKLNLPTVTRGHSRPFGSNTSQISPVIVPRSKNKR